MFQIQVETDPGSNPAHDYDINRSESEMACHYSTSQAMGSTILVNG